MFSGLSSRLFSVIKMIPQIVFVLGGPGAGKGTQCERIVKEFGFVHLSAGDLLREERTREGSPYQKMIEDAMVTGNIVPVAVTCSLLEAAMKASGRERFLIDGFPRNEDNLEGWNETMSDKVKILFVLFFDCSQQTCIDRCISRGAAGSGRPDDNLESLKLRYNTYLNSTLPIIDHYDKQKLVRRIEASENADEVFKKVKTVFNQSLAKGDS